MNTNNLKSNQLNSLIPTSLALTAALLFTACTGSDTGFFEETSSAKATKTAVSQPQAQQASIVHSNQTDRLATIRRGHSFEDGAFLIVKDGQGKQTAVLKALPMRASGLRTAYVLEGEPLINNSVVPAGAAETARLAKIYRDPEQ